MTADTTAPAAADSDGARDLYAAMMRDADAYTSAIVAGASPPVLPSRN